MMTRVRLGALVLCLLAIAGLTAAGLAWAGTAKASPQTGQVRTVMFDCPGQPAKVRPGTIIVTCADDGIQYDRLNWVSWTPGLASASGQLEENDCTPDCADGHFHSYPALVVLWGDTTVKNHPGERCYTKMTIILTGVRPKYVHGLAPATQTISLPMS